jgi:hypothetical protein
MLDPLSGPKGSPFGGRTLSFDAQGHPEYAADDTNLSTGALQTGIGFGSPPIFGLTAPASIRAAGFNDDYTPGITRPNLLPAIDSTLVYIGGGRCNAQSNAPGSDGVAVPNPYDETAVALCMAGNGGSRDAGAGPAFTGFTVKTVTATGSTANGAAVEAGWVNRSGVTIPTGASVFGSSIAANAAPV